jgi:hypothetical protein
VHPGFETCTGTLLVCALVASTFLFLSSHDLSASRVSPVGMYFVANRRTSSPAPPDGNTYTYDVSKISPRTAAGRTGRSRQSRRIHPQRIPVGNACPAGPDQADCGMVTTPASTRHHFDGRCCLYTVLVNRHLGVAFRTQSGCRRSTCRSQAFGKPAERTQVCFLVPLTRCLRSILRRAAEDLDG